MKQQTLMGFENYGKTMRREQFLAEMERLMSWMELAAAIEPVYPKGGSTAGGRPPVPLEQLLRIYFLQPWLNLSDPVVEEAMYDSAAMRSFVGIDLGREPAPYGRYRRNPPKPPFHIAASGKIHAAQGFQPDFVTAAMLIPGTSEIP
jgi:hypothetical protein